MSAPRTATNGARVATAREIARGLVGALRAALQPEAGERARAVARDVAQVLGLDGLDAVLAELGRAREAAAPADLEHVAARLERLAAEAEREESAAPFRAADAELAAHANALRETEWTGAGDSAAPVYAAADVLADLPLEPGAELARARLAGPVAASLRAALDWIGADEALLVQSAVHDSALALTTPVSHAGGLGPAGAVLATVEGSLGPEPDGRWTLRVPLYVERPSFLLLRVGHVPIALPWHSVARLRMLPPAGWEALDEDVLEPLAALQPGAEERPGALVAMGLARAWLVADRIVWRIATLPEGTEERGPFGVSTRAVRVESGEHYWVLEPAWLLRNATPIRVPPPSPRPRPSAAAAVAAAPEPPAPAVPAAEAPIPEAAGLADAVARAIDLLRDERAREAAAPAPAPSREAAAPAPAPSREMPRPGAATPGVVQPRLAVLRPEDVTPLDAAPSVAPAPAPAPAVAPAPSVAPTPAPAPPIATPAAAPEAERPSRRMSLPGRRALVADDSLVARVFLARLLERRGYSVELVGDGLGLWQELGRGPWALVCADVTMPDSHGRPHVERLLDFRAACREPFKLIVLTRDAGEERDATLAGATLHLRKPFDPGALDDLLAR